MKLKILFTYSILIFNFSFLLSYVHAQAPVEDSTRIIKDKLNKEEVLYPEIKGYIGIVHPLYTISSEGNSSNFDGYYLVGLPCGINIWKSKKFGV